VSFADEPPTWGHPPDPKVQSKSFKLLQRHLDHQEEEEDGTVCKEHLKSSGMFMEKL